MIGLMALFPAYAALLSEDLTVFHRGETLWL